MPSCRVGEPLSLRQIERIGLRNSAVGYVTCPLRAAPPSHLVPFGGVGEPTGLRQFCGAHIDRRRRDYAGCDLRADHSLIIFAAVGGTRQGRDNNWAGHHEVLNSAAAEAKGCLVEKGRQLLHCRSIRRVRCQGSANAAKHSCHRRAALGGSQRIQGPNVDPILERRFATSREVQEGCAERVDIGRWADLVGTVQLLRTGVGERHRPRLSSAGTVTSESSDAKIAHLDLPEGPNQEIVRLDVTMDDAQSVSNTERLCHVFADQNKFFRGK